MKQIEWIDHYLNDAEQLMYSNEIDKGLRIMNGLLYEEPGYGRLHNNLGWAYMYYTSNVASAELHLKMAIRFDESSSSAYHHLGALYFRQGRYREAIESLDRGVGKPDANKFAVLDIMAQAYELSGDLTLAIKTYKRAMMASVAAHEFHSFI